MQYLEKSRERKTGIRGFTISNEYNRLKYTFGQDFYKKI